MLFADYWIAGPIRTLRTLQYALEDPLALSRVQRPTLIVQGEHDPIAGVAIGVAQKDRSIVEVAAFSRADSRIRFTRASRPLL